MVSGDVEQPHRELIVGVKGYGLISRRRISGFD
jgi:hypothetical protein